MAGQEVSHYRIIRRVGEGGMGKVYAAQDLNLDRRLGEAEGHRAVPPARVIDPATRVAVLTDRAANDNASDDLLRQAMALDPDFALAHAELGRRYYLNADRESRQRGNPPLGVEALEDWLHAHVPLAQIRERQGHTESARQLYQRLLTTWKDAEPDAVLLSQARAGRART